MESDRNLITFLLLTSQECWFMLVCAWLLLRSRLRIIWRREPSWMNCDFQKHRVIFAIGRSDQRRKRNEKRTPWSHVHFTRWTLERRTCGIRSKRLDDRSRVRLVLVEKTQGDLLLEWPRKKSIILASHENEKEREVCTATDAISIEINSSTHFVAARTCEEWRWVEGDHFSRNGFLHSAGEISYSPHKDAGGCLDISQVLANAHFVQLNIM